MKVYIENILNRLKNYSLTLDKSSILVDKPWALIDDENEVQKLIFKRNNELVLSKNGKVQDGSWEYFPEAKSLLINRGGNKILCKELYIDENLLFLKLDGTSNQYFSLANENVIPDLDITRYLKEVWYSKFNILEVKLLNGNVIEVHRGSDKEYPKVGNQVTQETLEVKNGNYLLSNSHLCYNIENGLIKEIYYEYIYSSFNGEDIYILQFNNSGFSIGDFVNLKDARVPDGIIDIILNESLLGYETLVMNADNILSIEVFDGKIYKILSNKVYKSKKGIEILMKQSLQNKISLGDYAFIEGKRVIEDEIEIPNCFKIIIRKGEISEIEILKEKRKGFFYKLMKSIKNNE